MDSDGSPSRYSSPTHSSRSSSPPPSPQAIRGRFYRPRPNRSPSPVRHPPFVGSSSRDVNQSEPLYPWRRPPVVAASPRFEPEPRNFVPGDVKTPTELLRSLSPENANETNRWLGIIKTQHRAYYRRHVELVRMMQDMERGMRRLEADPEDWERFGFDKLAPMPMFLRQYCRGPRH